MCRHYVLPRRFMQALRPSPSFQGPQFDNIFWSSSQILRQSFFLPLQTPHPHVILYLLHHQNLSISRSRSAHSVSSGPFDTHATKQHSTATLKSAVAFVHSFCAAYSSPATPPAHLDASLRINHPLLRTDKHSPDSTLFQMASHSPQDWEYSRRYLRGDVVDERDPRYFDNYGDPNVRNRDLVPRADPRDSSLSVEEVRRDFPPPSGREYAHSHDVRRARSAEPGYYQEDYEYRRTYGSRLDARDSDRHSRYAGSSHGGDDRKPKHTKTLSKQEKLIAAVAGAALLVGGKELYDRHEAKKEGGTPVQRNALSSAALAGFGALAAYGGAEFYSKQQARKDQKANYILQRGRDGRLEDFYESDGESDTKEKKGHKNFLESAIAATGLGAAVKTLTGLGDDKHSDTRSRGGSPSSRSVRSRSSSRSGRGASKVQKAAIASLLAGATEAFRVAKEPGGWKGEKTKRILTAAAGAATVDAAHGGDHGKLGLAESVIGGLVGNRLINGSRNDIEEDRRTGRSRSRSRARSKDGHGGVGLAALATAGLGAIGAKKAFDRSRSRGRDRSYSRSPERDRHRSRSRSVVDKARDGLAKLGFGSGALVAADDRRRRDYEDDYDDRSSRHSGRRDDDHVYDDPRYRRRGHDSERGHRGESRDRSRDPSRSRDQSRRRGGYGSESDLGDSSEDERRAKKMRDHRRH
ncbi:hypothetical protein V8C42DRAFT_332111 [Trichoderma barbatum]